MALTPNHFHQETLAAQREEQLARKAARHHALGRPAPSQAASPRRWAANALRTVADWLARPDAPTPGNAGHFQLTGGGHPQAPSKS